MKTPEEMVADFGRSADNAQCVTSFAGTVPDLDVAACTFEAKQWPFKSDRPKKPDAPSASHIPPAPMEDIAFDPDLDMNLGLDDNMFNWEMIGLGLEEPLPPQDTIDEL